MTSPVGWSFVALCWILIFVSVFLRKREKYQKAEVCSLLAVGAGLLGVFYSILAMF